MFKPILNKRWLFDEVGCTIAGFIMYFVGCAGIYLMTAISIERQACIPSTSYNLKSTSFFDRYWVISSPLCLKEITVKVTMWSIGACFLLALIWPVLPLFGWSHYTLEGGHTSCAVEWAERSFNVVSYNVTIWICVFLIPLIIITFTNLRLICIVRFLFIELFDPKLNK